MVLDLPPQRRLPMSDGMAHSVHSRSPNPLHGWFVLIGAAAMLVGCADSSTPSVGLRVSNANRGPVQVHKQSASHTPAALSTPIDPKLPDYTSAPSVSGSVKSVGSDTMNDLMTLWSEGFRTLYPSVRIEIEGKGSSTAMPALIAGTATFGPMSRDPKTSELDPFEKKFGYKPTLLPAAIDMLAVYVNKDNPIHGLTLAQVDAIYSLHRKGGHSKDIATWGDLGLTGEWKNRSISLYGRNAASGTNGYFKEHALFGGDYKGSVKELPGSSSVVQAVAGDKYAIGYSGIGYITAGVRAVPLAEDKGLPFVAAEGQNAYSGEYPLARLLLIAVNYKPGSELDPLRREFVRYLYSRQGQSSAIKAGYFPVSATIARKSMTAVGLDGG